MLPWQEEELRQLTIARRPREKCVCCQDTIYTERCLDLTVVGLPGFLCERCVDRNMLLTIDTQED